MIGNGHDLFAKRKNKQQPSFPTTACNRGANGSPQPFVPPFAVTNVPTHPGVEPTRGCAQPNMSDTFVLCAAQSQGEGKGREPREDQSFPNHVCLGMTANLLVVFVHVVAWCIC